MKYNNKNDFEKVNVFGTGNPNVNFAQYFVGESFLNPLTNGEFPLFNVTFEPGRQKLHVAEFFSWPGVAVTCFVAGTCDADS